MSAYAAVTDNGTRTLRPFGRKVKQNTAEILRNLSPRGAWAARTFQRVFIAKHIFYGKLATLVSRAKYGERNTLEELYALVDANVAGSVPIQTTLILVSDIEAYIHAKYAREVPSDADVRQASHAETVLEGEANPVQQLLHECVDTHASEAYEHLTREKAALTVLIHRLAPRAAARKAGGR